MPLPMKKNVNLWPFGIIAAFAIFISATVGLIVVASSQKADLVNDNYYEQEIRYQRRIDTLDRTSQLGSRASVYYDAVRPCIVVSLPAEHAGHKVSGRIELYRPSAAGLDQEFPLEPDPDGVQTIDAAGLQAGLWKVRVSWKVEAEEFFLDQKIVIGPGKS